MSTPEITNDFLPVMTGVTLAELQEAHDITLKEQAEAAPDSWAAEVAEMNEAYFARAIDQAVWAKRNRDHHSQRSRIR